MFAPPHYDGQKDDIPFTRHHKMPFPINQIKNIVMGRAHALICVSTRKPNEIEMIIELWVRKMYDGQRKEFANDICGIIDKYMQYIPPSPFDITVPFFSASPLFQGTPFFAPPPRQH